MYIYFITWLTRDIGCGASPTANPGTGTIIEGGMSDPVNLGVTGGARGSMSSH
jgi:hypothetical protein